MSYKNIPPSEEETRDWNTNRKPFPEQFGFTDEAEMERELRQLQRRRSFWRKCRAAVIALIVAIGTSYVASYFWERWPLPWNHAPPGCYTASPWDEDQPA